MKHDEAMFDNAFPCNPRPFARALATFVCENGTNSIQSDKAKRILWILQSQAYGQLATIDLCKEWDKLHLGWQAEESEPHASERRAS